jgi:pimeloyl-ACP methyl ester carboxylesterase
MELDLGGVSARWEEPPTLKFAYPFVLIPELFATISHLSLLAGYLLSLGWGVYTIDVYEQHAGRRGWSAAVAATRAAITAIERKVVIAGHGFGGLLALAISDHPGIAAALALAPAIPGFDSPLCRGAGNTIRRFFGCDLNPPTGRRGFEFIADADPFHRESLIKELRPAPSPLAYDVTRGAATVPTPSAAPRLVIVGDSDIFAPRQQTQSLAINIGAQLEVLAGRGHWIIGGRALERAVGECQRFLVKHLGEELLLLYSEKPEDGSDGQLEGSN